MGKLYITGRAKQELNADMVNIQLRFEVIDKNSTKSLYDVTEQCERFLGKLKDAGFCLDKIHLTNDGVSQSRYNTNNSYVAHRCIEFDMPFEITRYNALLDMIRNEQYEVSLSSDFYVSNIETVRERLIQEAVLDSQIRAARIAETMGKKIIGCKEINVDGARRMVNPKITDDDDLIPPLMLSSRGMDNSNQLGAPLIEEEKTVSVTWIIE